MHTDKDKCIYEIGNVILNFGRLEYSFKYTLPYISKVNGAEVITIVGRLSFKNIVELFGDFTLLKFNKNTEIVKEIKSLLSLANKANDMRNDLLHSYWYDNPVDKTKPLYKYKMRKNYTTYFSDEMIPFGFDEIKSVNDKINEVYNSLVDFMQKHFDKNFH